MKVYISGPVTGTHDYMERFARAERSLQEEGCTAVNPAKVCAQLPADTTHGEYMRICIPMLDMCEAVLMLEGWQESRGCSQEFEYAYGHGITITFEGGRK